LSLSTLLDFFQAMPGAAASGQGGWGQWCAKGSSATRPSPAVNRAVPDQHESTAESKEEI